MEKILVLHVKKGYEDREQHINAMMGRMNLEFEYILDGDIADLNPEVLDRNFKVGEIGELSMASLSCSMKHLLAYRYIVDHNLKGALILEDDMVLYDNFIQFFNDSIVELSDRINDPVLVSYEDSSLHFVPRSKRVKGQYLYENKKDRFAGAYYCIRRAAEHITEYVDKHKMDLPIDLSHTYLVNNAGLRYCWCHPCIATQGSHSGLFASSIQSSKQAYKFFSWKMKLAYKKLMYFFR